jgi:hypothetical protein
MFYWTDNIMRNIPQTECEEYSDGLTMLCGIFFTFSLNVEILCKILSVSQNTVMALNNVMKLDYVSCAYIVVSNAKFPVYVA